MSLLTSGPETLIVYPSKLGLDSDGNELWRPWQSGDPVITSSGWQVDPVLSNQEGINGQIISDQVRAFRKTLPPGLDMKWDRVTWNGSEWFTEASPFHYRRGRRTSHFVVTLTRRGG